MTPAAAGTRPLYWSIRRELWENRSIYIAPLAAAAVYLFGFLISAIFLPRQMRSWSALEPAQQHELIVRPYSFAALVLMGVTTLVAFIYCLDALYGERRDRSILFWKSLPVSDLRTVLAKASVAVAVLPLLSFAITVVMQSIMLMVSTVALLASGSVATLWSHVSLFRMSLALLYHLLGVHGLWYAPIYGWLLLVSTWARRAPLLWAVLPPLAIGLLEKLVFNTSHFAALLGTRLSGGMEGDAFSAGGMSMDPLAHLSPGHFLVSPGLWLGLLAAAGFLALAVRLRRDREPI